MNPLAWWQARSPWQKRAVIGGALALSFLGGLCSGRFSAPLKVETRDVIKTEYKDRVQYVEKKQTDADSTKVETRIIYRNVIIKPDGTKIDNSVIKTGAASEIKVEAKEDSTKVETVSATKLEEHTQTVTLRPDWSISLGIGASLPKPWLSIYGPLVLSVELDRRIVGDLSIGIMANTGGQAFGVLKFEF